jgi:peptide deformylase
MPASEHENLSHILCRATFTMLNKANLSHPSQMGCLSVPGCHSLVVRTHSLPVAASQNSLPRVRQLLLS